MLCAQWLPLRRLTVAHVTWTHPWPAARGSCQAAVTRPTPQRGRSARTRPRTQGRAECPTRPVTSRRRTCRLTSACARRTRRWFTAETLTDTHSQVIWVFFPCVCCVLTHVQKVWLCELTTKVLKNTDTNFDQPLRDSQTAVALHTNMVTWSVPFACAPLKQGDGYLNVILTFCTFYPSRGSLYLCVCVRMCVCLCVYSKSVCTLFILAFSVCLIKTNCGRGYRVCMRAAVR